MAQAKVSYTWGRESMRQYNESLAGVRAETPNHNFTSIGGSRASMGVHVSPYDMNGKLLPGVHRPEGNPGEATAKFGHTTSGGLTKIKRISSRTRAPNYNPYGTFCGSGAQRVAD